MTKYHKRDKSKKSKGKDLDEEKIAKDYYNISTPKGKNKAKKYMKK